ncbi:DNA topology modulation protein [Paenibacillus wulumuqiensis]|uniref:DNA topology modulation protein n=1 Tax=Paenibacillus wulumuqiensis TaxID=1567107 RepID=UPI0006194EEE|nr:DNA topology modulation protein [Paenibacillus wulumuqiensis]
MQKIAIIGSGGSGKSTLSRKLAAKLQLPVYHLDSLYWRSGWVPTPAAEWDQFLTELTAQSEWIIDGNYGRTMDIRLREADTIIYLDYPTYISLFRAVKRRFQYKGRTRPDMAAGCEEKMDLKFAKWIWRYRRDQRPKILKKLDDLKDNKTIYIFTSPRQLERFLEQNFKEER